MVEAAGVEAAANWGERVRDLGEERKQVRRFFSCGERAMRRDSQFFPREQN